MLTGAVSAAPILRLASSVVTVEAPIGGTPNSQFLSWSNAGDGTLSLSFSISPTVSWLAVSAAGPPGCTSCIQFSFNTASLQAGNYTASVTVSDPNAVDSPQVVIVTAFIGGWPPLAVDQYVAPGTTANIPLRNDAICFFPGSCSSVVTTADGGKWLSLIVASEGTLRYFQSIALQPAASMASGVYTGNVTASFSSSAPGYNVPVTMRVTNLPIAVPSTPQISLQLARNGPATTYPFLPYISLSNSGMGTLQVTGVSASGTGVSAYNYNGLAIVTVDPGTLAPGIYSDGMVTIQCNAANCPVQVPVNLEVDAVGPPIVNYQGAVDNATFSPTGSPGDVMVVKGSQLSLQAPQTASVNPLPTSLGGASVLVNGVATPLYYSSFGQIAFQARANTYLGSATVQVVRDGVPGNTVSMNMAPYAPGIVVVTDPAYNVVDATHPVKAGSTLVFWALGLGATNPAVADGTAAPSGPAAQITTPVSVQFGLEFFVNMTTPSFVGLSPGSVGLYQVIATLPASTPAGTVSVWLGVAGGRSNSVVIAVQ
jgi:uncharacterized protein (TIGR03437 family)